jgi:SpoVK/Ycf46/Vps4 family AAA+-type ATPase
MCWLILCPSSRVVIRPRIPLDILGRSVGETEDTILSMFCAARTYASHVVLLLDNVENLLMVDGSSNPLHHVNARTQSTFFTSLDDAKWSCPASDKNRLLVICTAKKGLESLSSRLDGVFYLDAPDSESRRRVISNMLGIDQNHGENAQNVSRLLDSVVESTVGKSYAELTQFSRQALESAVTLNKAQSSSDLSFTALCCFKKSLLTILLTSLKSGVLEEYADVRILNAKDLEAECPSPPGSPKDCPMMGVSAAAAWNDLQAAIVLPLCFSDKLQELMHHNPRSGGGSKRNVNGILLTGAPGSGKSVIAFHCARLASSLLPSIKVLDVSCTSLIHKELGGSERAIHHLFESARRAAPCIVVLDGIENIASVRGNDTTTEGTLDRVLSTLLVEMDGIDEYASDQQGCIAIIGITQNASWIDSALKRPGRLGKVVQLVMDWI